MPIAGFARVLLSLAVVGVAPPLSADGFAEDREGIVEGLLAEPDPAADQGGAKGGGAKGVSAKGMSAKGMSAKSLDVPPSDTLPAARSVTVMREDRQAGKGARVIGVVERPASIPSVNLKVEFAHDSAELDRASRRLLLELGEALLDPRLGGSPVSINGHTDSSGPDAYNLDLSYLRAESVRAFLVAETDLDEARLSVLGFGEAVPLNANATEIERSLNRRVEIERLR